MNKEALLTIACIGPKNFLLLLIIFLTSDILDKSVFTISQSRPLQLIIFFNSLAAFDDLL